MIPGVAHLPVQLLRLPDQRHIPGSGSIPELAYLSAISSRISPALDATQWKRCLPYRYGWFLFNHLYFWEAHEVWETVWLKSAVNSRERFLLQGLIQLSNAGLKHRQRNHKSFERVMALIPPLIDAAFPPFRGLENQRVLMGVSQPVFVALKDEMHNKAC